MKKFSYLVIGNDGTGVCNIFQDTLQLWLKALLRLIELAPKHPVVEKELNAAKLVLKEKEVNLSKEQSPSAEIVAAAPVVKHVLIRHSDHSSVIMLVLAIAFFCFLLSWKSWMPRN